MTITSPLRALMLFGLSIAAPSLSAQVDLSRVVSCDSCTAQQRSQAVTGLAKVPGESRVLIVDATERSLYLYDVWVDQEPGLFHVTMDEITAPPEARQALENVLQSLPLQKTFEPVEVPSQCVSEGSSFAANYVSDGACRGFLNELVRNSYRNSVQAIVRGPWVMQILTAYTRTPTEPRLVKISVRSPDGSTLELEATVEIDIDGDVIVTDIVVLRAIANSVELPLNAAGLRGQTYSAFTVRVINDFRRLFSNWSVENATECSTRQRIVCPPDPSKPCVSYISCAPTRP